MLGATKEENLGYLETAAEFVSRKGYETVLVDKLETYDSPSTLNRVGEDGGFTPDITAERPGRRDYYEIALKADMSEELMSKWQLISTMARMKRGSFYLMAPRGNFRFASDQVKKYNLEAEIIKI